jgi:lipoprotein-releasing system ATP-binding protein
MTLIQVNEINKSYGNTHVLKNIALNIEEKEQCALVGASGSGKSTLLYLLGGLERPDTGSIHIEGEDLFKLSDSKRAFFRNRYVGFVFQFHFLLPSMNCMQNILLPARIGAQNIGEVQKLIRQLAEVLGVTHCLDKMPYQLSGGEQQRINIIRAMSLKPKLLLCDEPTGNLDSDNSNKVAMLLKQVADEFNSTLLVVTHDAQVAQHFTRKITIEDGRIIS